MLTAKGMSTQLDGISDTPNQLGEGPLWWDGGLYWVDIAGCKLLRHDPQTGEQADFSMPLQIGTVVPRAGSDDLLVALEDGIYIFNPSTGQLDKTGKPEPGHITGRFNDGK